YGSAGLLATGAVGGSVDVDAVAFSFAGMLQEARVPPGAALAGVLVSLAANAVLKTALAASIAGFRFARFLVVAFLLMFTGALIWIIAWA
ncbi:MAG: DUF4010 domain-containing protein, partial [Bryobacteraceae bacterium]